MNILLKRSSFSSLKVPNKVVDLKLTKEGNTAPTLTEATGANKVNTTTGDTLPTAASGALVLPVARHAAPDEAT